MADEAIMKEKQKNFSEKHRVYNLSLDQQEWLKIPLVLSLHVEEYLMLL